MQDSPGLQLTTPAVWDSGSQQFYAAAQAASPASNSDLSYMLVCWPAHTSVTAIPTPDQNCSVPLTDPLAAENGATDAKFLMDRHVRKAALPRAVHSLWPLGPPWVPSSGAGGDDADGPSTSGRAASGPASAVPRGTAAGVMIVHTDGSVALNTQYMNGRTRTVKPGEGHVAAASGSHGLVAVVTVDSQKRHRAAIYAAQVRAPLPAPP